MASEDGDQGNQRFQVTHEIDQDGFYRLTVFEQETGKMCFSWGIPTTDALDVATMMIDTVNEWLLDHA